MKGEKNGRCNRTACNKRPASYFNIITKKYYCEFCARLINEFSKNDQGIIICIKENHE